MLFCRQSTFLKNSFRNTIRVANSLDPDQARHFVGPHLGLNCLQWLSADNTSWQRINRIEPARRPEDCPSLLGTVEIYYG